MFWNKKDFEITKSMKNSTERNELNQNLRLNVGDWTNAILMKGNLLLHWSVNANLSLHCSVKHFQMTSGPSLETCLFVY